MFCPKCGKNLDQGARFCNGCGAPIQSTAPQITPPSQGFASAGYSGTSTALKGVATKTIILLIAGAFTAIGVLFLSWVNAPIIKTALDYAPSLLYGSNSSTDLGSVVPSEFTLFKLGELFAILQEYTSYLGSTYVGALGSAQGIYILFLILSLCSVALIAVGIVFRFLEKKQARTLLLAGFIMAATVSLIWCLMVMWINGAVLNEFNGNTYGAALQMLTIVEPGTGPILTLIASAFGIAYLLVAKESSAINR